MAADLPTEFDLIVLGTGLPESIIAAAFSRNGYKVLHLDRNTYYSSSWASFSLSTLEEWAKSYESRTDSKPDSDFGDLVKECETVVSIPTQAQDISSIKTQYHVRETSSLVLENVAQEHIPDSTSPAPEMPNIQHKPDVDGAGDSVPKKDEQEPSSQKISNAESPENIQKENSGTKQGIDVCDNNVKDDQCDATSPDGVGGDVCKSTDSSVGGTTEEKCEQTAQNESSGVTYPSEEQRAETQEKHTSNERKIWSASDIKKEWRKFNLDLAPKILYSTSKTVDLLISSDVAKYCEFRTVSRVLTFLNGQLDKVPCSRADVFSSKKVSVLEKRMLMKFLTSCAQSDEHPEFYEDFKEKPFCEFLKAKKLTPNIHHFVQHSIAMVTDEVSTEEGMKKMKRFLVSLGRYGNTAFLFPLYGSGELPQAFCRLCAVFGGTYCLQMSASALVIHENRCCAVITTEGQRIECKHVILGPTYTPKEFIHTDRSSISRGILLTDKSILHDDTTELSLLYSIPQKSDDGHQYPVSVLELPPSSMVCPRDMNVIHLTRQATSGAEADLASTVDVLFTNEEDTSKPSILWSLYFTQKDFSNIETTEKKPDNVYIMPGPGTELDMDSAVEQARRVWETVCPEEEFLPKPPNPEDIIYVDNEETKVGEEGTGCLETDVEIAEQNVANTSTETGDEQKSVEEVKQSCSVSSSEDKSQDTQFGSLDEKENKDTSESDLQKNDEK
ncbi:rab proteins geranylgeranyltransferase component A-like [Gigantopelta aegis]|uniref:rab proteins geranylgeranyltransferase component A-like n=1 Tax=Gigantopelta aegis TaxID=1735272 RepID=UPI001B88CD71|nr:rab proteins geranylgeranyltransferase component A-like [Gigantopelta aegis]